MYFMWHHMQCRAPCKSPQTSRPVQVKQLQMQLAAAQQELTEHTHRADSCSGSHCSGPICYDHWTGSSLFTADTPPLGVHSGSHAVHALGPHTPPRTHSPHQVRWL